MKKIPHMMQHHTYMHEFLTFTERGTSNDKVE
jgi:hypothetical protein